MAGTNTPTKKSEPRVRARARGEDGQAAERDQEEGQEPEAAYKSDMALYGPNLPTGVKCTSGSDVLTDLLIFVVCGGIIFELLRMIWGAFSG
jgi:hypothetical protein